MLILGNMLEHVFSQLKETLSSLKVSWVYLKKEGHLLLPFSWSQEGRVSLLPLGANPHVAQSCGEVSLRKEWWHHKWSGSQPLREVAPSSIRGGKPL